MRIQKERYCLICGKPFPNDRINKTCPTCSEFIRQRKQEERCGLNLKQNRMR